MSGEIPTAAQLNTDIRDNLNELALHSHMGGSGSGTAALGNLVSITYIDAAIPAAPGGTLTRTFTTATNFGWINAGGTFIVSTSGHEHAVASGTIALTTGSITTAGTAFGSNSFVFSTLASASATATLLLQTATIGGAGSRAVAVNAFVTFWQAGGGGTDTVVFEVRRGATSIGLVSTSALIGTGIRTFMVSTIEYNVASGSYTYNMNLSLFNTTFGTVAIFGRGLSVQEIKQA